MALPTNYTIPPGTREFTDGSTDIVRATLELLIGQGHFTNLLSDLAEYALVQRIMPKHKKAFAGGLDWTFKVAVGANNSGNGTAKFISPFENDTFNRVNVLVDGKVSPRFITANYVYSKLEQCLNSGEATKGKALALVEFVKLQLELMYQSAFDLMENTFAGVGPATADDKKTPHGLAFYIQKQAKTGATHSATVNPDGGLDGLDPMLAKSATDSTLTACPRCDISSSTYARWANWAARYSKVSKEDLVRKMRIAAHKINFKSPLSLKDPTLSTGRDILTNLAVLQELETILEAQNMNLGNDVASKDGKVLFKGAPIEYIPILDGDTENPIYMIDWKTLVFGCVDGWDKKVSAPIQDNNDHNLMKGFLDMSCEMVCTNLRNQAVLALA